jgi:arsenate reductase (glutaredoxin)
MKVTMYWYPRCGTCRSALKWLQAKGIEADTHDIFETAPSKETVRELWKLSGLNLRKLFNTSGEVYRELELKDKLPQMSEEEMLDLLSSNGRLIKRPIVTDGKKATVGFKEEQFAEVWA